ncbi:hypothetical protein ACFQGT_12010 [Natrialbaceae archaeon GCM10025810]|uniref:hypothetical protein n=1 Tax=Halovalidus salilacus TaxID=3075124 RepID=UPI003616A956
MTASKRQSRSFAAACPTCDVERTADSANELIEFYRRHSRHTGHEIEWLRADVDVDLPAPDADPASAADGDGDALERVVADLEAHYDDGVPIGLVAAAMARRGYGIGETLDALREVRLTGALYEPRDDHVAVV